MSERLVNTFCAMVQISSESGNERDFIYYLKDLFTKELGANCVLDDFGNLIAKIPARNSSSVEPIFFGLHADT
ncbi:unnamed protein product, partial [marine sediment metagenome]